VTYEDFAVIEKSDSIGFEILIRMELLTEFSAYFGNKSFSVYDVLRLGIDICKALESCRELNIIHRDIKPENIFISSNGDFKLGDFGIARTVEKTMVGLSRKGTYSYMAPEIYNGSKYGFETDIYSLGLVLYKLLNNNRDPFLPNPPAPVMYSDKMESMLKRMQGEQLPAPANADDVLTRILFKACAYEPSERYAHPSELRTALEEVADNYRSSVVEVAQTEEVQADDTILLEENVESEQSQPMEDSKQFVCPVCNRNIKEGVLFCGFCGHKLDAADKSVSPAKYCPNCGCKTNPGIKFCGKCGYKL
jgi:serine/threonine-protein kinase